MSSVVETSVINYKQIPPLRSEWQESKIRYSKILQKIKQIFVG